MHIPCRHLEMPSAAALRLKYLLAFAGPLTLILLLASANSNAQDYPSKPIRIITSAAGGGSDFVARQIANGISGPLGQPVIIDNRPQGPIAAEVAARSPPDGYSMFVASGAVIIAPLLRKSSYDVVRDFAPISQLERTVNVVVVHPSLPVKSIRELVSLAQKRPGQLNYGSGGIGPALLAAELFKSMASVNMVNIPYKGNAAAIPALVSGEVQMMIVDPGLVAPHVKIGRLRALAVTSAEPSILAPGLPTVASSGLPGYEAVNMTGMFAPAKTSAAIIKRLHEEIVRVLSRPDTKERFFNAGLEVVGSSPEQLAAAVKADITKLTKVIKDAGIKVE